MKIKVTQKHILRGIRGDVSYCPVAFAALECTTLRRVGVNRTYLWHLPKPGAPFHYHHLPYKARRWVTAYDAGLEVEPFEFDLEWSKKKEECLCE